MRLTLILAALALTLPAYADDWGNAATQPADAATTQPAAKRGDTVKERKTGDGFDLPPVGRKWFGDGLKIGFANDAIGKTPEEAFQGSARLVKTLEKSKKAAEMALAKDDKRPLTMPYYVLNKFGADYVGFALLDGRIVALDVRWKWFTPSLQNQINTVLEEAHVKGTRGPDAEWYGFSSNGSQFFKNTTGNQPAPAYLEIKPSWNGLFCRMGPKPDGHKEKQVAIETFMISNRCNHSTAGTDDKGEFVILSAPDMESLLEDRTPKYVDKFKVYVKDGKAVTWSEIKSER